jgi:hypothetical protein
LTEISPARHIIDPNLVFTKASVYSIVFTHSHPFFHIKSSINPTSSSYYKLTTNLVVTQTVERMMKVRGKTINPNDLINIFIQEAEHHVIGNAQTKMPEATMITSQ